MNSSIFYTLSLSFFRLLLWLSLCIVHSVSCFVFVMLLLLQVILSHVTILSIGRASTCNRQQVSEYETFTLYGNLYVRHMSHVRILLVCSRRFSVMK